MSVVSEWDYLLSGVQYLLGMEINRREKSWSGYWSESPPTLLAVSQILLKSLTLLGSFSSTKTFFRLDVGTTFILRVL